MRDLVQRRHRKKRGWFGLWVVLSALWVAHVVVNAMTDEHPWTEDIAFITLYAAVPPILLYLAGIVGMVIDALRRTE